MSNKDHPHYCPVMDMLCPQAEEKAQECQMRFEADYDPIKNFRDFDIICCSHRRTEQVEENTPLV